MRQVDIGTFLREHELVEKIPYFGKARLYTAVLSPQESRMEYRIPREIFHFITVIYVSVEERFRDTLQLRLLINDCFEKEIRVEEWSRFEKEERINLLSNPLLYGQGVHPRLRIERKEEGGEKEWVVVHLLVEYAKISPELYQQLHEEGENEWCLISQQGHRTLTQSRGQCFT